MGTTAAHARAATHDPGVLAELVNAGEGAEVMDEAGALAHALVERLHRDRSVAAERVLATVLFTDIVDSTAHAARLGDQGWREGVRLYAVLLLMVAIWFVLGCLIDSISILLLTVPIFYPIAIAVGLDPLAFAIIGIVAVETGLLTPPFGLLVFTVKAAIQDPNVGVGKIFDGSVPYWIALLTVIVCLWQFPQIATYLPSLLKN